MKVIDLLNKIANGKELPKKVKWDGEIFEFDKSDLQYYGIGTMLLDNYIVRYLNDEIEIIEEPKKIEKLYVETKFDFDKHKEVITSIADSMSVVLKVNEIIDYINKGE